MASNMLCLNSAVFIASVLVSDIHQLHVVNNRDPKIDVCTSRCGIINVVGFGTTLDYVMEKVDTSEVSFPWWASGYLATVDGSQ